MSSIKRGLTRNTAFAAWLVIFSTSFPFGYNGSILNQPNVFVVDFYNRTYTDRRRDGTSPSDMTITVLWSTTNSAYIVGSLAGYFLGGFLMDAVGRKNIILIGQIFLLAGTVLSTCCLLAKSPEMLILGRILLGILGGIGNSTSPIFLAEISPSRLRGAMGVCHQLSMSMGSLASAVVGLPRALSTVDRWPYLHLINVLCSATALVFLPLIPDTPRYIYLVVGDEEKARKSLVWYRGRTDVDEEMEEMAREKRTYAMHEPFKPRDLLDKKMRRPLTVAIMLQINRQLTAFNAIIFYTAQIFTSAGSSSDVIPFAVVGVNAIGVFANVIAIQLIDNLGRRKMLIGTTVVMIGDLILLVVMMSIQSKFYWAAIVSIVCVYVHILMTHIGIGPISWVLSAELFQQQARPTAGLVAGVVNSVAFFTVIITFSPIHAVIHQYIFVIYAVILSACLIFSIIAIPETKNRRFSEIARNMTSDVSHVGHSRPIPIARPIPIV